MEVLPPSPGHPQPRLFNTLRELIKHRPRVGRVICPVRPPPLRPLLKLLDILVPWTEQQYPGRIRMAGWIIQWNNPKAAYSYICGRGPAKQGRESRVAHKRAAALARSKAAALVAVAEECEAIAEGRKR